MNVSLKNKIRFHCLKVITTFSLVFLTVSCFDDEEVESTERPSFEASEYDDQIIAAPGVEKEDALEKFVSNNTASTGEGKSGCMKSIAFLIGILTSVYAFVGFHNNTN